MTDPDPPKIATPPTTAAATDLSSNPSPATTVMLPNRARNMNPASPASAPAATKARKTVFFRSIPAISAASGLEPTANSRRAGRNRVRITCTATTIATAVTKAARNSTPATVKSGVFGNSTSHTGSASEVIDFASEYSTSSDRKIAIVASVTMIEGTRA